MNLARKPKTRKYWHIPPIRDDIKDEAYCIRHFRELFMKSLESYVNGCQNIAVFLSGGLDSGIIVAGLRELGVHRISTFTIGFHVDPSNPQQREDLAYARLVAEKFATKHHEVVIESGHNPRSQLLRVVKQFDDLIMTPNTYSKKPVSGSCTGGRFKLRAHRLSCCGGLWCAPPISRSRKAGEVAQKDGKMRH